ncbi:MAG: S-methyl-5'-thioinosine phosphorylase [Chromatiales bacterium]|jgi:purine nucleoside phosphorylase|nr:S-methyl-5'-thioinosine phosphorylase [Chromatiales bacterium]
MRIAIIGGSGSAALRPSGASVVEGSAADTPWGAPSGPLWSWQAGATTFLLQHRHGDPHRWLPHEVNYRANVWQLHRVGVDAVVGANTVGHIDRRLAVGDLVMPDQLIDYTWGRPGTFGGTGGLPVGTGHVEFTQPFDAGLRARLGAAAAGAGVPLVATGTYGVTQGPRLETAAEIERLARDGCTIVGMTASPEAVLAREAGLPYALLCVSVNAAAGRGLPGESIHASMAGALAGGLARISRVLAAVAAGPAG